MARKKAGGKKEGKRSTGPRKVRPGHATGKRTGRASKELLDYRQMQALAKKERVHIFSVFCDRVASPKEVAAELGEGLSQVSYHVKVLRDAGLVVLERKVPRRGAVEHFYRAAMPTLIPPNAWARLSPAMRRSVSASILQEFVDDASASMAAGLFDGPPGELSWTPLILDEPGLEELGELTRDFLDSVLELQAKANKRLPRRKGKAVGGSSATVFLASFLSARSARDGKKASATKRR